MTETPKPDSSFLFGQLTARLRKAAPEVQQRITAHVRALTNHSTLPAFISNGTPEEDKVKILSECLKAIITNDFTPLQGQLARGQAVNEDNTPPKAERETPPAASDTPQDDPEPSETPPAAVEAPKPPPAAPPPAPAPRVESAGPVTAAEGNDLSQVIARAIAPYVTAKSSGVDEAKVNALAKVAAELAVARQVEDLTKSFRKMLDDGIHHALAKSVRRIEFLSGSGEFKTLDGLMHPQVPQLAAWLRAGVPVWAWGAAGSGKTHMARQVAQLMEVDPYVMSVDPTLTVAKIMGYRNVTNGDFVEGFADKPYKCGGLLAADEKDTGDPGVMASANALLSNQHYLFPNAETVARHDRFHYLALANTKGTGAVAGYTARNRLDAATLDRFAIIEVKYDPGLTMAIACGVGAPGEPWKPGAPASLKTQEAYVRWVQSVHADFGNTVLISPRAAINGCKALRVGIPLTEVVDALVFKLIDKDSRERIEHKCGLPQEVA